MAADGHNDDGSGTVRRLRKLRFTRPSRLDESNQRDFPVFLASAPDENLSFPPEPSLAEEIAETFAERWRAWRNWLVQNISDLSIRCPTEKETQLIARIALVLLFVPLAIALSPNGVRRTSKTHPSQFVLEDRLSFGDGLRQRLASGAVALSLEKVENIAELKADAAVPVAEDSATLTFSSPVARTAVIPLPALVMDERQWSLPFNSQNYAVTDLPTSPQASFKTKVDASSFPEEIESIAAQNDVPVVAPLVQAKRLAERRKRVLAYSRRIPRVNRMPPAIVETVVVEQQEPVFPPLLFFLGGPAEPEPPPPPQKLPPKNQSWISNTLQDIFKD